MASKKKLRRRISELERCRTSYMLFHYGIMNLDDPYCKTLIPDDTFHVSPGVIVTFHSEGFLRLA